MKRVLACAELLSLIFTFTDNATDVCCTTVCRIWFEAAIRQIWHTLDGLQDIFAILAPIIKLGPMRGNFVFVGIPRTRDWDRFFIYSSNVKNLTVDERTWSMTRVFYELIRTRTRINLFPALDKLTILIHPDFSENITLYLYEGLSEISLKVPNTRGSYESYLQESLETITDRTGQLKKFTLKGDVQISGVESRIVELFHSQRSLECVVLPLYTTTSSIVSGLSSLPELKEIELYYYDEDEFDEDEKDWGKTNCADVLDFDPTLSLNAFPKLWKLELAVRIQDLTKLFSMNNAPTNITCLYVHVLDIDDTKLLHKCLEILVQRCELLVDVYLQMTSEVTETLLETVPSICFDDIHPLLERKDLKRFQIRHPNLLRITAEELDLLTRSWPNLEYLSLNPDPLIPDEPLFDLSVLAMFAKNCPKLMCLELYLDALSADLQVLPVIPTIQANLESLYFGFSPVGNTNSVAVYLGMLCAPSCELITSIKNFEDMKNVVEEESLRYREERQEIWIEVKRLLSIVTLAIDLDRARTAQYANSLREMVK